MSSTRVAHVVLCRSCDELSAVACLGLDASGWWNGGLLCCAVLEGNS